MFDLQIRDGVLKIHDAGDVVTARVSPRSTTIVQALQVGSRIVVREDYYQFVGGTNVYCVDRFGRLVWDAELSMPDDTYANPVFLDSGLLSCGSWNGITCAIDPKSGKIVSSELTK